jgi:hypothetical protein
VARRDCRPEAFSKDIKEGQMIGLTGRYLAMDERTLADSLRFSSICLDCATRLGTIQARVAGVFLTQRVAPSPKSSSGDVPATLALGSDLAMDEVLYWMGEANRVLVDSQSQLRLILEKHLGDATGLVARRPSKRARINL